MVPVPPDHRADPVQQQGFPVLPVPGEHLIHADTAAPQHVPHAVAFHIVLVDHIQAQLVAQAVQGAAVRIVAGPHRVDIVPLHQDQVPPDLLLRHGPAGLPAEVVPVGALENDPHTVHPDHTVHDFDFPEACAHGNDLLIARRGLQPQFQGIQVRILRGPQPGIVDAQRSGNLRLPGNRVFRVREHVTLVQQLHSQRRSFRRTDLRLPGQDALRSVRLRQDLQVPYMRFRHGVQEHVPVDPGEAQEVLVLQPAAGAEAVHPARQLVLPVLQRGGQFKLVRREAVRGETDILSVQPDRNAAFHSLEGNENPLPLHTVRQEEMLHIAGHGIEALRDLPRQQRLVPRPRIHGVAVLRNPVPFHLDMGRHPDVRPSAAVVFRLFKAGDHLPRIHGVEELPLPVQAHPQGGFSRFLFRVIDIPGVIRMRIQPVLPEIPRILQSALVKHDLRTFLFQLLFHGL